MKLATWQPLNQSLTPFGNNWPSFFDNSMSQNMMQGLDMYETDNDIVVKAPVAGVPANDVDVTFEDGILRIHAYCEENPEENKKKKNVYTQQRVMDYDYMTTLPRAVDAQNITADVEDGVVTVTAPIAQTAKARKIAAKPKGKKTTAQQHEENEESAKHNGKSHRSSYAHMSA